MAHSATGHWQARVLIVVADDERREQLLHLLREQGLHPIGCVSAAEAIDHLRRHEIGVAVVDESLPDSSGAVLRERIHRLRPATCVVLATGSSGESPWDFAEIDRGERPAGGGAAPAPHPTIAAPIEHAAKEAANSGDAAVQIAPQVHRAVEWLMAKSLAEQEASRRSMVDALPVGVFRADADGSIEWVNEMWRQLCGRRGRSARGLSWLESVHPKDRARLESEWRLAVVRRAALTTEFRFRGATGTQAITWVRLTMRPELSAGGRVASFIGAATDITENKNAELRQRFLMRELDHRVKNNLAAVLALVDQTLVSSRSMAHFRESYTGRIRALARTHEALAHGGWEGVMIDDVMRLIVAPFSDDVADRVRLSGESMLLPPRFCTPLCMAMHELTTNAAKHGALSTPRGVVSISWNVTGENRLIIDWSESGGPAPSPAPRAPGFGVSLIRGVIEYELGGRVHMVFGKAGLQCRLEAALDRPAPMNSSDSRA